MSDPTRPRDRKELYERIARGGREEVTLEEMIRLGFWSEAQQLETSGVSAARVIELRTRLQTLRTRAQELGDVAQLVEEARAKRLAESRKRRLETKQRRLAEREAKKAAWKEKQKNEIGYLGERVSAALGHRETDAQTLARHGVQPIADLQALAALLGITISQLRFLAFDREVSTVSHYRRFTIPKRTGGVRNISAPRERLKAAQHVVLEKLLAPLVVADEAHGFRTGRSIVTNALPHVGSEVVLNVDLRDFFPTLGYRRVKGLFRRLGWCEEVAAVLALLCTEANTVETVLDGVTYYVARGERRLPQGAPTSPAITNLVCRRLDRRLAAFAKKHGLRYTRYADDLTLSAPRGRNPDVGAMLAVVKKVVKAEGFAVHPDKISVKRRARRQEVTGVIVNERPGIDRRTLRRFRALLFQLEKDGPEGKRWGASTDVVSSAIGFANYVFMVDPDKGRELRERALKLSR